MTHRLAFAAVRLLLYFLVLCGAPDRGFAAQHKSEASAGAGTSVASPAFSFTIEPAPAWVVPAREPSDAHVENAPFHYRVIDQQTRLDDKGAAGYRHVVRVVDEAAGLAGASQIEIQFSPSFETLAWHHLDILRDGKRINRLDRGKIRLLQRETRLERQVYDGSVTASVVLPDVRVGDQIDFAYSIRGANPVFNGRFVANIWLASGFGPVLLHQFRLLAPTSRKIPYRVGSPAVQASSSTSNGLTETIFRRTSVPQFHAESNTPYSVGLVDQVQFSEFADWADVARWGEAVFAQPAEPAPAIDDKAAQIRAQAGDAPGRLLAALQFVQSEVRYFGTEIGPASHRPAAPAKVLDQRFGDCKDKVNLLVALLRRLDIPATPVLVSTIYRDDIRSMLPSPLAFDHVIARVELEGATYWLDATRGHQSGDLAHRQSVGFERGLPLAGGITELADLPSAFDTLRMQVTDRLTINRFDAETELEARLTYRGDLAEGLRESLASRSASEIETQVASAYVRIYPKIRSTRPIELENSTSDDAVTLVLHFSIPEFWRFPEERALVTELAPWSLADPIRLPNEQTRSTAYAIALPGIYRHSIQLEFPEDVFSGPTSRHAEDGDNYVQMSTTIEGDTRRSTSVTEVRLLATRIDSADWTSHAETVGKMFRKFGQSVTVSAIPMEDMEATKRELQRADEDLRAGKIKFKTAHQMQSMAKSIVLTHQLAGNRLDPRLRAQALTARGIQLDNLGRPDAARPDFDQAMDLAPHAAETRNAAAVNALQRGDYPRAIELSDRLLGDNAKDNEARNTRALARYFSGDYTAAKADVDQMLADRSQLRRGYPVIWASLLSHRLGLGEPAAAAESLPTEWPRPLVDLALGKGSIDLVLQSAKAGGNAPERLCEAYYYIGEQLLASGDKRQAAAYFQKSVDQGITEFVEDASSRNRLRGLKDQ